MSSGAVRHQTIPFPIRVNCTILVARLNDQKTASPRCVHRGTSCDSARLALPLCLLFAVSPSFRSCPRRRTKLRRRLRRGNRKTSFMGNSLVHSGFHPTGNGWRGSRAFGDKEKDGMASNLYLTNLATKQEIQLTRGTDNVSGFSWSPDGEWIAFVSSKARPDAKPDTAKTQIWLINPHGGEPYSLDRTCARAVSSRTGWTRRRVIFSARRRSQRVRASAEEKEGRFGGGGRCGA